MGDKPTVTYQLSIPGEADVSLRYLPSDDSIRAAVVRQKNHLDPPFQGPVGVQAVEGAGRPRELTPDEVHELGVSLSWAAGHEVAVYDASQGEG